MDVELTGPSAPRLQAPAGAWDTHIHIIDPRFPLVEQPVYQPPVATARDYQAVQRRLGLEKVLIVQSSTHGTDHACLLDAITQLGPGARGVGMVGAAVTDAELRRLSDGGVCAARFLMTPGGVVAWNEAAALATRVSAFGWLINLQIRGNTLLDRFDEIARLPGRVVVDHIGNFGPVAPDDPAVHALLRLIDGGRVWLKLSAPYAGGAMGAMPYAASGPLARAFARHAPERLIWGSDWPHTFLTQVHGQPAPDAAGLFDLLLDWVDDPAVRHSILVDTPEQLFGTNPRPHDRSRLQDDL